MKEQKMLEELISTYGAKDILALIALGARKMEGAYQELAFGKDAEIECLKKIDLEEMEKNRAIAEACNKALNW